MNQKKKKTITPLREKFKEIAYNAVGEYAERNNLSQPTLSNILNGKNTGEFGGPATIKVFECLKRDGIYEEEFYPWQSEYKEAKAKKAS